MRKFAEEPVAPSVIQQGGPTKPALKSDAPAAPSIIVQGTPTRKPFGLVKLEEASPKAQPTVAPAAAATEPTEPSQPGTPT